jgi:ArsR family transcriptional regulator
MSDLDALLATLSHPVRRRALLLLQGATELCLCELMVGLGIRQSCMSRHMAALKEVGLVSDRRDAQWVRYRWTGVDDHRSKAVVAAILAAESRVNSIGSARSAA